MTASVTLTPKETALLTDLKKQEQLCVDKTARYAAEACDGQLKNLFLEISRDEAKHVSMIDQIFSGSVPQTGGGSSREPTFTQSDCSAESKKCDKFLCNDMLSTEKHVSSAYDTSIFEFVSESIRNALNHIQKEEQQHGRRIWAYMSVNGMYE